MKLVSAIDVTSTCEGWAQNCPAAEDLARDAAGLALIRGISAGRLAWEGPLELGVTLADAAEQQRLNAAYRGENVATNVLAFPAWDAQTPVPSGAPLLLGDVVLAFETVAREAADQGKPLGQHLGHLVVHGVLHLLGFDHLTAAEALTMEALETSILAKLGIPDPYRDAVWPLDAGTSCNE